MNLMSKQVNQNRSAGRIRAACGAALISLSLLAGGRATAQVAVKTNLLYDATTTPNVGLEVALGGKSSVQLFYGLNPWKFSDGDKLRHWSLMPEYRYWLCRPMGGHFFGVHALGGQFNMGGVKLPFGMWPSLKEHRYEGWYAGGGLTYGYTWILGRHWNLEAALGLGYAYIDYEKYKCETCGGRVKDNNRHYFGPTKAALNIVYVF